MEQDPQPTPSYIEEAAPMGPAGELTYLQPSAEIGQTIGRMAMLQRLHTEANGETSVGYGNQAGNISPINDTLPGQISLNNLAPGRNPAPPVLSEHEKVMAGVSFDRQKIREQGLDPMNNFLGDLEAKHGATVKDAIEELKRNHPGDVPGDLSLKKLHTDARLRLKIQEQFPDFARLFEYSPSEQFRKNLNNEEMGTGIDPGNIRSHPDNYENRTRRYHERLEAAQRAQPDESSEAEEQDEDREISYVEAADRGIAPTVFPSNKQRRDMQRISDLKDRQRRARIKADIAAMWHGGRPYIKEDGSRVDGPYVSGPLRTPRSIVEVDPVRDDRELISEVAVESRAIYQYEQGRNAYGQVINHSMGRAPRRIEEEAAKKRRVSHIDQPDGIQRTASWTQNWIDRRAQRRYKRETQKIDDLQQEIEEEAHGILPRLGRRGRRVKRTIARRIVR